MELLVGLSYIDLATAQRNLELRMEELPDVEVSEDSSYATYKDVVTSMWCTALNDVLRVESALPDDHDITTMLYSAVYHSMMSPTKFTEADGVYLGFDKTVHNFTAEFVSSAPNEFTATVLRPGQYGFGTYSTSYFSDFSLWDTFRSQHPWILLTQPDVAVGIIRSMLQMTIQQDAFPRWALASLDTGSMLGESGMAAVVEAVQSGLGATVNVSTFQRIFLRQQTTAGVKDDRVDVNHYLRYGYVSEEARDISPSETLTYAFDDFLLAQLCLFVNDTTNYDLAMARSKNYATLWSPEHRFMCPRSASTPELAGVLHCSATASGPTAWKHYEEGNAYHWLFFVPHDVEGLIDLFDRSEDNNNTSNILSQSKKRSQESDGANALGLGFYQSLETFFEKHVDSHERIGAVLPNPYYWAGT